MAFAYIELKSSKARDLSEFAIAVEIIYIYSAVYRAHKFH